MNGALCALDLCKLIFCSRSLIKICDEVRTCFLGFRDMFRCFISRNKTGYDLLLLNFISLLFSLAKFIKENIMNNEKCFYFLSRAYVEKGYSAHMNLERYQLVPSYIS